MRRTLEQGHWRVSLYQDRIADWLYTQTDLTVTPTVTNVQHVDRVRSRAIESELVLTDLWLSADGSALIAADAAASSAASSAAATDRAASPAAASPQPTGSARP